MVTKESKLFTHLPDTAYEMAAGFSAKKIFGDYFWSEERHEKVGQV